MCEPVAVISVYTSVSGDQYSYLGANTKGEIKPYMDTVAYALASQLHLFIFYGSYLPSCCAGVSGMKSMHAQCFMCSFYSLVCINQDALTEGLAMFSANLKR